MKTSKISVSYGRVVPTGAYSNERMEITVEAKVAVDPLGETASFDKATDNLVDAARKVVDRHLPSQIDVKKQGFGPTEKYTGTTIPVSKSGLDYLKQMFGKEE